MEINRSVVEQLVQRVVDGEDKAFEELYRLTNRTAYFVALKITKNEQDALDILQDSYIKALQNIKQLSDKGSFVSWLNQIVANSAKNYICKMKPALFEENAKDKNVLDTIEEDNSDYKPDESMDTAETRKAVMEIIDSLSEDKRLCILMFYFDEMKISEIAETLGVPENTVKNRLFDGRKKIKEKIETLRKTGSTVLGTAPAIPLFKWLLGRTAATVVVSEKTMEAILAIIGGSSVIIAGTAAGGVAVTAGATTIAGIAIPKIIAIVVAGTAVVSGTAVGAKVIKDKIETQTTTQYITEEVGEISSENRPANALINSATVISSLQESSTVNGSSQTVTVITKDGVAVTITGSGTTGLTVTTKNQTVYGATSKENSTTAVQTSTTKKEEVTTKATTTSNSSASGSTSATTTANTDSIAIFKVTRYKNRVPVTETFSTSVKPGVKMNEQWIWSVVDSGYDKKDELVSSLDSDDEGRIAENNTTYYFYIM